VHHEVGGPGNPPLAEFVAKVHILSPSDRADCRRNPQYVLRAEIGHAGWGWRRVASTWRPPCGCRPPTVPDLRCLCTAQDPVTTSSPGKGMGSITIRPVR